MGGSPRSGPAWFVDSCAVVGFKAVEGGIEHFPPRDDNGIEAHRDLVASEHFPSQPFRSVSIDRRSQFAGCRYSEPPCGEAVGNQKYGHVTTPNAKPGSISALELPPSTNSIRWHEPLSGHLQLRPLPWVEPAPGSRAGHRTGGWARLTAHRSSATVKRLRPFARRRFSTIRPFLEDILTRNP